MGIQGTKQPEIDSMAGKTVLLLCYPVAQAVDVFDSAQKLSVASPKLPNRCSEGSWILHQLICDSTSEADAH